MSKKDKLKVRSGFISWKERAQYSCLVVAKSFKRMLEILNDELKQNISQNHFRDYWGLGGNNAEKIDCTSEGVWVGKDRAHYPDEYERAWPEDDKAAERRGEGDGKEPE